MAYIKFHEVTYSIKKHNVLEGLSVDLAGDSFTSLVGPNGVGKTTFSKLLLGVIKPNKGTVWLDGRPVGDYPRHEVGGKVGYLFQNPNVQIFAPTIREELSFASEYKGLDPQTIKSKVDQLIEQFSLEGALETPTYHLSQGEKQRLAIAAMLMNQPQYMVLDEPTTGLDYGQRKMLRKTLLTLHSQGIGMLLISHDEAFVQSMPGQVMTLSRDGLVGGGLDG